MGLRARALLTATLALLLGAAAAPAALAVSASVRVEGAPYEVSPATAVIVSSRGTLVDSDGTSFTYKYHPWSEDEPWVTGANALAALDRAATKRGFTYGFNTFYETPFLDMIAGLAMDPADWTNSWTYFVNGVGYPVLDMGVGECVIRTGDRVVFAQNPDATFSLGTKLLRLRFSPSRAILPGETVTIAVLGDNVAKANSTVEATRWGLDPVAEPEVVEAPADFAPVSGVTIHVGDRVYVDGADDDVADGAITVSDLPQGTHAVWAEMAMDATFTYVRSATSRVDVDNGPRITSVRGRASFSNGRLTTRVGFTLDKRCDARVTVFNQRGKRLATMRARNLDAGRHALAWRGRPAARVNDLVSFVVEATDPWGRVATKSVAVRVAR